MECPRPDHVCASLADQFCSPNDLASPSTLALALGANLPSAVGPPLDTLRAVRPALEQIIQEWLEEGLGLPSMDGRASGDLRYRWSPLFETDPVGGPADQPAYLNAVVVVDGALLEGLKPCESLALALLEQLLALEKRFGRDRQASQLRWGPRCLDLDLLAWGGLHVQHQVLTLPHPRLIERSFVVVPLAAALTVHAEPPRRISPHADWPE